MTNEVLLSLAALMALAALAGRCAPWAIAGIVSLPRPVLALTAQPLAIAGAATLIRGADALGIQLCRALLGEGAFLYSTLKLGTWSSAAAVGRAVRMEVHP